MKKTNQLFDQIAIVIDTREQDPYSFSVSTLPGTLQTGDYSVLGFEDRVAVERKSIDDFVTSTIQGRERFERELQRSRGLDYFALVVEADLADVAAGNYRSRATTQSVIQSVVALSVRHRVPVWLAGSREFGQRLTESLLVKYARDICQRFDLLSRGAESQNAPLLQNATKRG
tara:strand:+ start:2085 stop:2603 length:519 start_codon:yes stop_codon:yes gene_type:complete